MTGFKSKKALSDRMADAEKEDLRQQNEWQLGMDKWQRGETAPKDGEYFLALTSDNFYWLVRWTGEDFDDAENYGPEVCYWMPLPPPPEIKHG